MESPFFCDMAALTTEARVRHRALATQIRPVIVRFSELDDGYAAEFGIKRLTSRVSVQGGGLTPERESGIPAPPSRRVHRPH
jgi:hypothetical protein